MAATYLSKIALVPLHTGSIHICLTDKIIHTAPHWTADLDLIKQAAWQSLSELVSDFQPKNPFFNAE